MTCVACPVAQASIFGRNDGPGCSLVMYFGLPEGWTPEQEPNKVPCLASRCI